MTKGDDRRELHWLEDIEEAIDKIQSHEQYGKGNDAFQQDEHYRVWVFYHMERVGECVTRLRQDFDYDNKHPEIDWKGTQGMRRHLVHRYWAIDKDAVWKGVEYLPKIKDKVVQLQQERKRALEPDKEHDRDKDTSG